MARFQEVTGSVSKYYLSGSSWIQYASRTAFSQTTALRFKTESNNPFYLSYRTYNKGKGWLPYVSSTNVNDYAGYPATDTRCVQSVGIRVIDSATGASLDGKYIAMYRAYANGKWQAWVSNAKPELMYAVFNEFNLEGSLDTASGDAGAPGTEHLITRFELRVFKDNGVAEDDEGFTGGVVNSEKSILVGNAWKSFTDKITEEHIDGIKLQTSTSKNYYLLYKTWNEGRTSYYPAVKSNENDYAGYPNKPIQKVNIQVCRNDGTTMGSGVIVMYRACVDGEWQPWVSNADPEWMASTKAKLGLDGTLNETGTYAGEEGKNIEGIDIRIYEDDSTDAGTGSFVGVEKAVSLRYMVNTATNWVSFDKKTVAGQMDGIEIKTSGTGYYLLYKTWNAGKTSYYPAVKSTDNDYAGVAGRAIQKLNIKVYKNDGTQLTKDVVVMYRARVDGAWQPWVSNADPEWMVSVKEQFNLEGSLDTAGGYAGAEGKNIQGIEVRLFEGSTVALPEEELPGTEATATTSYLKNGTWTVFDKKVEMTGIDGIKIQTSTSKSYYLAYKTQNEGQSSFYPIVTSTQNDYAGSPGKPIQKLCIHVYRNDGTKLATGVVVMYRARVDGVWQPWVSNADPDWMQAVQVKYALGGRLDTESYYAGINGKNIDGIEIRIFEENTSTTVPVGNYKIIPDVPFISQVGTYPTGCESVTTVMALQYAGVDMSVDTFIDDYLDKRDFPFDPYETFGGNPRSTSGYGCYAPVIKRALNKFLPDEVFDVRRLTGWSLRDLCTEYIDNNVPVILWATMGMKKPYVSRTWTYGGTTTVNWIAPEHCLLLVGYDDNHYIFNDPLKYTGRTYYSKEAVEVAYNGLFKQAVVIENKSKDSLDFSDRYRRERAQEILEKVNVNIGVDFAYDQEYVLVDGPIRVTYKVGCNTEFRAIPGATCAEYVIEEGKVTYTAESLISNIFTQLKHEVTLDIGFDDWSIAKGFISEIENGTVKYGMKINTSGKVIIYYYVEEILRQTNNVTYNQIYEIEMIIDVEDTAQSSQIEWASELKLVLAETNMNYPYIFIAPIIVVGVLALIGSLEGAKVLIIGALVLEILKKLKEQPDNVG